MIKKSKSEFIRLFSMLNDSIVDGEGFRFTVFTQGCNWNCDGCHNPESHDLDGGAIIKIDEIVDRIVDNQMLEGVTISGGEPFLQVESVSSLIDKLGIRAKKLNIWIYTGYKVENLFELASKNKYISNILKKTKVIVDGQFEKDKRDISQMRGSTNQRFVDVQKTIRLMQDNGKTFEDKLLPEEVIEYEFEY